MSTPRKSNTPSTSWKSRSGRGKWFNAANWSNGVPTAATDVVFAHNRTQSVQLGNAVAVAHRLEVGRDTLTLTHGTLDLTAGTASPDLRVDNGGSLTLAANSTVAMTGEAVVGRLTRLGAFTPGTLTVAGVMNAGSLAEVGGAVTVAAGGTLNATGNIQVLPQDDFGLAAAPTLTIFGVVNTGVLEGAGDVNAIGTGARLTAGAMNLGIGTLSLMGGASALIGSAVLGSPIEGAAFGSVDVSGIESSLTIGTIVLSGDANGAVSVSAGGILTANSIDMNVSSTDGNVSVTGTGSALTAGTLNMGGVGNADMLSVRDGAALSVGAGGLTLDLTGLQLDSSVQVSAAFIASEAGTIAAVANGGDALISSAVTIGLDPITGRGVSYLEAGSGATLTMQGTITETAGASVVTEGDVVFASGANVMAAVGIMSGTLELAAPGAGGGGTLSFLASSAATLQVDSNAPLNDTIAGFGGSNAIDLAGFAFNADIMESYSGGTLTLNNGSESASLVFTGSYSQDQFVLTNDNHGGTVITFQK